MRRTSQSFMHSALEFLEQFLTAGCLWLRGAGNDNAQPRRTHEVRKLDLIHHEALSMAVNRETPAAVLPVRPAKIAGRPVHDECRFFLSGSHSLKRFKRFFTLLIDSLHWFARLPLFFARPHGLGGVRGGTG